MKDEDGRFSRVEPLAPPRRHRVPSRLARAVSVPGLAGAAVFVVAVVIAILMVAVAPHEPGGAGTDGEAEAAGRSGSAEGSEAARLLEDEPGEEAVGGAAEESKTLYVHVVGEVESPGVVELPEGSRVADAIEAAGGATAEAQLAGVNLARAVIDGEQIAVPDTEQAEIAAAPGQGAPGAGSLVNLNTADQAALETLPGVGPALAQRIIAWREANGSFSGVEQLLEVSGIGEKTLEGFRELVTV